MSGLLTARDVIRDFIRKYGEIIIPVLRFVLMLVLFTSINSLFGYSPLLKKGTVVFLLSIICALVSDSLVILIAGTVVLINSLSVSVEVGVIFLLLLILMYTLYMRMFPKSSYVLAIALILCKLNLIYAIPLIVVMLAGMTGIVPMGFGIITYYFAGYVKEAKPLIDAAKNAANTISTVADTVAANADDDTEFQAFSYIIDNLISDKNLITAIIVFALTIAISYIIYRLPFNYSWYIAIGVGALLNLMLCMILGSALGADLSPGAVFLNIIFGVIAAFIIQFCKGVVNYRKKESVQFEDDEYYYYVNAIPKYTGKKSRKKNTSVSRPVNSNIKSAQGAQKASNTSKDTNLRDRQRAMQRQQTQRAERPDAFKGNTASPNRTVKKDYVSEAIRENMKKN